MKTSQPPLAVVALASFLMVGLVGFVDLLTGPHLSFFLFYLAPIGFAGWYAGMPLMLVVDIVSAFVWAVVEVRSGVLHPTALYLMWNTLVRLVVFTLTGWLLIDVRAALMRETEISRELRQSLAEARVLRGLLPICASCKNIRDEKNRWHRLETYISDRSEVLFSHGLCPECLERYFREAGMEPPRRKDPDGPAES